MFYRFMTPLTEEDMTEADFLAQLLDTAVTSIPDGNYYYFRALWYPGENDENILGLMMERDEEPGEENPIFDTNSPEGRAVINAIAEAFGMDPAMLGGQYVDDPVEDEPVEDVIGGGSSEVVRTKNGGSVTVN